MRIKCHWGRAEFIYLFLASGITSILYDMWKKAFITHKGNYQGEKTKMALCSTWASLRHHNLLTQEVVVLQPHVSICWLSYTNILWKPSQLSREVTKMALCSTWASLTHDNLFSQEVIVLQPRVTICWLSDTNLLWKPSETIWSRHSPVGQFNLGLYTLMFDV